MENLTVKVDAGSDVTIRKGEALPLKEPTVLNFTGVLDSVSKYLDLHGSAKVGANAPVPSNVVWPEKAVIIVDKKEMSIKLIADQCDPYSHTVKGILSLSDELKEFGINAQKVYDKNEFVKLLRFNGIFFSDSELRDKMLSAYMKLSAQVVRDIKDESDMRGNKDKQFKQEVKATDIPDKFVVELPVFQGYDAVKIEVEVCMDATESKLMFWLESPELANLIRTKSDELMKAELDKIGTAYVVLTK